MKLAGYSARGIRTIKPSGSSSKVAVPSFVSNTFKTNAGGVPSIKSSRATPSSISSPNPNFEIGDSRDTFLTISSPSFCSWSFSTFVPHAVITAGLTLSRGCNFGSSTPSSLSEKILLSFKFFNSGKSFSDSLAAEL